MRSVILTLVVGAASLGLVTLTPSKAEAGWRNYAGYPAYYSRYSPAYYPTYYAPAYQSYYYAPPAPVYPLVNSSYYPTYNSYYYTPPAPVYRSYYYAAPAPAYIYP